MSALLSYIFFFFLTFMLINLMGMIIRINMTADQTRSYEEGAVRASWENKNLTRMPGELARLLLDKILWPPIWEVRVEVVLALLSIPLSPVLAYYQVVVKHYLASGQDWLLLLGVWVAVKAFSYFRKKLRREIEGVLHPLLEQEHGRISRP
jgi:hypothetical protein